MVSDTAALNIRGAATLLGAHEQTVRKLARRGAIPCFKVGRDWRFRKEALLRWADGQQAAGARPFVLIVDDEEKICEGLVRIVEGLGCRAQSTTDARVGLEIASRDTPDLILLDLIMPSMDGPKFLEELRKTLPAIPVVIVTAFPDSDLMARAMELGPLMLLAKPFDASQVEKTVRVAVGKTLAPDAGAQSGAVRAG